MKTRRPPPEAKVAVMNDVMGLLQAHYVTNPEAAIEYLLNNFTTYDLVEIRHRLKEMRERDRREKGPLGH